MWSWYRHHSRPPYLGLAWLILNLTLGLFVELCEVAVIDRPETAWSLCIVRRAVEHISIIAVT